MAPSITRPKLQYQLSDPGFTIYHRAALGGLAATVQAWKDSPPQGVLAKVTPDEVDISWSDELPDQEALKRILQASFRVTKDKIIDLPGQGIGPDRQDLQVAVHNGLTQTFLQHAKNRPGEKAARMFALRMIDEGESAPRLFSYKAVNSFAHQTAQGTGLLDDKLKGKFPELASISQFIVPGAFSGASKLQTSSEEGILLLFLIVGCAVFQLRPRSRESKAQSCIVVPDVCDLKAFSKALHRMADINDGKHFFANTFLGRVVGGVEEAALRLLVDFRVAEEISNERSVSGCQAIAMGRVAWDSNQVNRSMSVRIRKNYPELDVFRVAVEHFGKSRILTNPKGENFIVTASSLPEIIAANLALDKHWCAHFSTLAADKKEFKSMLHNKRGLGAMKEAVRDTTDQAVISALQEAWRRTLATIFERSTREGLASDRLIEVEREKMRNAILRCKTADMLAGWFLRFCADATKGGSLQSLRGNSTELREFIFNQRNFERFQNLCLFAMVSYESKTTATKE
jgi:CRISPR-associated protein Cas8a1/Csx13